MDWSQVYGSWKAAGYETDVCLMETNLPAKSWKDLPKDAAAYGRAFAKAFGPSSVSKLVAAVEVGNEPGDYDDATYRALFQNMAAGLREASHDAVHVRDYGLREAEDIVIFERAAGEERVIVSADTDFGTLLAVRQAAAPSVILFRRGAPRVPRAQVDLLVANLPTVTEALAAGSIVVFEKSRVRVRSLPIAGT